MQNVPPGCFLLCFGNISCSCCREVTLGFSLQRGMIGQGIPPPYKALFTLSIREMELIYWKDLVRKK